MDVTVNGEVLTLGKHATVAELLKRFGLEPVRVAVEKNRAIVPRKDYALTTLDEGDKVEIVTFVGGG